MDQILEIKKKFPQIPQELPQLKDIVLQDHQKEGVHWLLVHWIAKVGW